MDHQRPVRNASTSLKSIEAILQIRLLTQWLDRAYYMELLLCLGRTLMSIFLPVLTLTYLGSKEVSKDLSLHHFGSKEALAMDGSSSLQLRTKTQEQPKLNSLLWSTSDQTTSSSKLILEVSKHLQMGWLANQQLHGFWLEYQLDLWECNVHNQDVWECLFTFTMNSLPHQALFTLILCCLTQTTYGQIISICKIDGTMSSLEMCSLDRFNE